jgi:hypothetical protein
VVSLAKAEEFMWLNARLVDRLRFAYHFRDGDRAPVLAALRPYQNSDGGFGHAFEPDMRGPDSQPCTVDLAFTVLDQVDAMDDAMVPEALRFLESITRPDGGVPWVLPSIRNYPHGPWWQTDDDPSGSLNPTAGIVGRLVKHGVSGPWIDRATEFCWTQLEAATTTSPYEVRAVLPFLDNVHDRGRADRIWQRMKQIILDGKLVTLDPHAEGEVHFPLDYAPSPDTLARQLVSDEVIEAHLDVLAERQDPDGGWRFNFLSWTPITEPEWRGWVTIESLQTLRAYGRI